ncbi:universal stress protein [Streptomyces kaniharaensis]|uniref:Universal stress protein n=1 Tax=Streptomyces kaniharaensis TaxID=212423 RepID=A0A6N7KZS8_9ACTN|nr:universal stress protein [Streptomyces kaniharaensis]MQS16911.1 universal stress protein [Streptomyces kaniharaensis]
MDANDSAPRVVVGVDGSPSSHAALRWAVRHAKLIGGVVDAVGAWEPPSHFGWSAPVVDMSYDKDLAERRFTDELQAVLGADRPVEVRQTMVMGDPSDVLLDAAQGAELLVVGSHGHTGFTRALLGSVSTRCAQHATCPVVIVRAQ